MRKTKSKGQADGLEEEQMMDVMESIEDTSPLPQEMLDSDYFTKNLNKILGDLPAAQSQTVIMYLSQEMTFQEIADALNEPLNTIKSRYRRAMASIKETLNKNAPK